QTHAFIGAGANVTADDVEVRATDSTAIIDIVGGLAGSKDGKAVGVSLDVAVVLKDTEAFIAASDDAGAPTTTPAARNVGVGADSSEDVFTLTISSGLALGSGQSNEDKAPAGAGNLTIHWFDTDTRAFVGRDPQAAVAEAGNATINAQGSVAV